MKNVFLKRNFKPHAHFINVLKENMISSLIGKILCTLNLEYQHGTN